MSIASAMICRQNRRRRLNGSKMNAVKPCFYAGLRYFKKSFDNSYISAIILVIQWFMDSRMI